MRRFLIFAFLAVLFFSHFFVLLTKFTIGVINTQVTSSIALILLFSILYALCIDLLASKKRITMKINPLDVLIIIYASIIIIQIFNPHLPFLMMALRGCYESGLWVLSYFIARFLIKEDKYSSRLVSVIAFTSFLGVLYALFVRYFGIERAEPIFVAYSAREDLLFLYRNVGTIGSPFGFGLMCAIGFVAAINIELGNKMRLKKIAVISLTLFLLYGVIMSGSRSVMLGILTTLMVILILTLFKKQNKETVSLANRKNILKYMSLLILVSVVSYILFLEFFPYYAERVSSILNLGRDVGVIARVDLWRELIPYLKLNPMGYGTGSLGGTTYRYGPVVGGFQIADNQYLEIAIEYGVIGLVSVLSIFLMMPILYLRVFKLDRSGVSLSALLAIVIVIVSGIGAPPLKAYPGNLFFGALLGAFSASYSSLMAKKENSSTFIKYSKSYDRKLE